MSNVLPSHGMHTRIQQSYPKGKNNPIHPPARSAKLADPKVILEAVQKITTVELSIDHIIHVMNVLSYDGKVEIIKLTSKAMSGGGNAPGWSADLEVNGGGMDSDEEREEREERKRKRKSRDESDEDSDDDRRSKKKKKRSRDSSGEDEDSDDERAARKKKKAKEKAKKEKERAKRKRKKEKEKERSRSRSRSKASRKTDSPFHT